jgi:hypothetical protein
MFVLLAHLDRVQYMLLIKPICKRNGLNLAITFYHLHICFNMGHNGQYWRMAILTVLALYRHGRKYGLPWCISKVKQKCRSTVKTVSKNMQMAKSYCRNEFIFKIMAISLDILAQFLCSKKKK